MHAIELDILLVNKLAKIMFYVDNLFDPSPNVNKLCLQGPCYKQLVHQYLEHFQYYV